MFSALQDYLRDNHTAAIFQRIARTRTGARFYKCCSVQPDGRRLPRLCPYNSSNSIFSQERRIKPSRGLLSQALESSYSRNSPPGPFRSRGTQDWLLCLQVQKHMRVPILCFDARFESIRSIHNTLWIKAYLVSPCFSKPLGARRL